MVRHNNFGLVQILLFACECLCEGGYLCNVEAKFMKEVFKSLSYMDPMGLALVQSQATQFNRSTQYKFWSPYNQSSCIIGGGSTVSDK